MTVGYAPHSLRAVPREWLTAIARARGGTGYPLHIHAGEQPREVEESLEEFGLRPIEHLYDCGVLGDRTTVVHATHVTPRELDLLAESEATVCACPTTEANLGDGFLPAAQLWERGVRVSFGADSNVRLDPFEEARETEGCARRLSGRRNVLVADGDDGPAPSLWRCLTANGAHSLGLAGAGHRPRRPRRPGRARPRSPRHPRASTRSTWRPRSSSAAGRREDPGLVDAAGAGERADVVRLPGRMLVPGLVNGHSHAFQRHLRGRVEVRAAERARGRLLVVARVDVRGRRGARPARHARCRRGVLRRRAGAPGYTTVGEFHYVHHRPDGTPYEEPNELALAVIEAARAVGVRIVLLMAAYARGGAGRARRPASGASATRSVEAYLDRVERLAAPSRAIRS